MIRLRTAFANAFNQIDGTIHAASIYWKNDAELMTQEQRDHAERTLSYIAEEAARAAAYFGSMEGHFAAVRKQNAVARAVRKALGYSYPKNDRTF